MKIHVRRAAKYPMNYYSLCNHNTKNRRGFVPLDCQPPKIFINIPSINRCKHCEKALNERRARKGLKAIDFNNK
jgi:hypothetical protein